MIFTLIPQITQSSVQAKGAAHHHIFGSLFAVNAFIYTTNIVAGDITTTWREPLK